MGERNLRAQQAFDRVRTAGGFSPTVTWRDALWGASVGIYFDHVSRRKGWRGGSRGGRRIEHRCVRSPRGALGAGRMPLLLLVLVLGLLVSLPRGVVGQDVGVSPNPGGNMRSGKNGRDGDSDSDRDDDTYAMAPWPEAAPLSPVFGAPGVTGGDVGSSRLTIPSPPAAPDGFYLMDIPKNIDNWDTMTGSYGNFYGWNWPETNPCGVGRTWTGVLCRGESVISVNLANLRLRGQLSVEVMKVPTLEGLDMSGNFMSGFLPAQWSSKTLKRLILSNNQLQGKLPAAYGALDTFPAMERMMLDGNLLTGMLPGSQWLSSGFAKQAIITLRPGNDELCGSVPVVDPRYYGSLPDAQLFDAIDGDGLPVFLQDTAFAVNTSQVYLVYTNLFAMTPQLNYSEAVQDSTGQSADDWSVVVNASSVVSSVGTQPSPAASEASDGDSDSSRRKLQQISVVPNLQAIDASTGAFYPNPTNVVITNTLGACAIPCGKTAPLPSSNLLVSAWELNMTLTDILRYNSGLESANAVVGKVIALPCYEAGMVPAHSTSDAALNMFAGGNQRTVVGTVGAEIAGAVVRGDGLPVGENGIYFEGIKDYVFHNGAMHTVLVEPVYWFVDLGAEFTVTALTITSGNAMSGLSIYIGSDTQDIFGNTKGASGLEFSKEETKMVLLPQIRGKYAILLAEESAFMSLANVKVWTAEGNMAIGRVLTGSPTMRFMDMEEGSYGQMLETNYQELGGQDSCSMAGSVAGEPFSVELDNGSDMSVNSVSVDLRNVSLVDVGQNATLTVYTASSEDELRTLEDINICKTLQIKDTSVQIGVTCGSGGRFVGLRFENVKSTEICEFGVYVSNLFQPTSASSVTISSSDIVGIIVGSVIGGAILVLLLIAALWWRKRRKSRKIAANKMVYHDAEKGVVLPAVATMPRNGSQTSQQSGSSLSPQYLKHMHHLQMDSFDLGPSSRDHSSSMDHSPTKRENSNGNMSRSENLSTSISSSVDCIDFADIELLRTIGEGSYGLVWLGRYLQTSVAVKVLTHDTKRMAGWDPDQPPSDGALMALQKEASIMASLRHPNCVQYLGCCIDPPALVMEFCSRRSVDKILNEASRDPRAAKSLDWVHLLGIAADAAKGMLYLHTRSPPIIHRDLKSPNLLVDALWHVKISDFNLSRAMEQDSFSTSLAITNPRWLAPEILRGEHGGRPADVYSFGVVLWELMSWKLPWGDEVNPFSIINGVLNGKQLVIPGPDELQGGTLPMYDRYVTLIRDCWSMDAADRPSMAHVATELRSMLSAMLATKINSSSAAGNENGSAPSDESSE